jgi:hypothetical protein
MSTDAKSYDQGVPLGEQLTVSWRFTGDLSRVSIVLLRKSAWDFPQYIEQGIINSGQFVVLISGAR